MPKVAAIGAEQRIQGYALAGARVLPADGADEVRSAWQSLDDDVVLVLLTAEAAGHLGDLVLKRPRTLTVVTPP